jgi:hypothetical protein
MQPRSGRNQALLQQLFGLAIARLEHPVSATAARETSTHWRTSRLFSQAFLSNSTSSTNPIRLEHAAASGRVIRKDHPAVQERCAAQS